MKIYLIAEKKRKKKADLLTIDNCFDNIFD